MDGYKTLKKGQKVEFQCTEGPKGLHATEIRPSGETEAAAMVTH
jgi:CspA family cold shock protein